jgi:ribosomal protein L34E
MKTIIEWKQTTSKNKICSECGKKLFGQCGFVNIKVELKRNFWNKIREDNLCMNCFEKLLKGIEKERGTAEEREKKFNLMLKRRMLINLK